MLYAYCKLELSLLMFHDAVFCSFVSFLESKMFTRKLLLLGNIGTYLIFWMTYLKWELCHFYLSLFGDTKPR